ncbi:MAG: hypothetical protein HY252_16660 [Sphingobacteriales bacterium]|nr:hypothetical protein [Sphingobacteriales bacterium]
MNGTVYAAQPVKPFIMMNDCNYEDKIRADKSYLQMGVPEVPIVPENGVG